MRTPMIAGNWKMNTTVSEAADLVNAMRDKRERIGNVEKVLCPPFISLTTVRKLIENSSIKLGAQNVFYEEKGAYTGEISPPMLAEICEYVIIGHEHPVLYANVNGFQKIRAPIFLKGPITNHNAQLIVQPSFTNYSSGTPIHPLSKENLLSPILREEVDLSLFELYALNEDKEVLHFPSLDKWL